MPDLTQQELQATMHYNEETGDFIRLKDHKVAGTVNQRGFMVVSVKNKRYMAHKLAHFYMTGKWPEAQVRHANGVRTDNSWANINVGEQLKFSPTITLTTMHDKINAEYNAILDRHMTTEYFDDVRRVFQLGQLWGSLG